MSDLTICPICGDTKRKSWGYTDGYSIVRCSKCGIGITSPFPNDTDIRESNSNIYTVNQRGSLYLKKRWYFENRYNSQLNKIKQHVQGGRLLDIGCNIGLFLHCAQKKGFTVEGIEFNQESASFGSDFFKIPIHTKSLEEINYPENTFDVITMYDVLEHIPDPKNVLDTIKKILKPDGLLVIQSPNIDSLMAQLTGSNWCWLTPPDHLFHFTPQTLKKLLTNQGFNIVSLYTWEPIKEFSNNLIASWHERGLIPKILRSILRDLKIIWFPTMILQRLWWRRDKGGLLEILAKKKGKP